LVGKVRHDSLWEMPAGPIILKRALYDDHKRESTNRSGKLR